MPGIRVRPYVYFSLNAQSAANNSLISMPNIEKKSYDKQSSKSRFCIVKRRSAYPTTTNALKPAPINSEHNKFAQSKLSPDCHSSVVYGHTRLLGGSVGHDNYS